MEGLNEALAFLAYCTPISGTDQLMIETMLSGLGGVLVGALISWLLGERQSKRKSGFALMQGIQDKLSIIRPHSVTQAQCVILEYYQDKRQDLTPGGLAYLDLISALDFFLFARDKGFILSHDTDYWLRGILTPTTEDGVFVKELRASVRDSAALEFYCSHVSKKLLSQRK